MKDNFFLVVFLFSVAALCFSDGFTEEEQGIVDLLYETQTTRGKITFIKKINMGMPGGDNYVAVWDHRYIGIYVVDKAMNNVKEYAFEIMFNPDKKSQFDIMKDIPGTRLGVGSGVIGDYNNDGIEEVFVYILGGYLPTIAIYGYDITQGKIVVYLEVCFDLVDPDDGPAPAEFTTYQGVEGIKIYQDIYNHPPRHYPKHEIDNTGLSWYFYAWDEGSREYVELAEIGEDIDYSMFTRTELEETAPEPIIAAPPSDFPDLPAEPGATAAGPAGETGLNYRMIPVVAGLLVFGAVVLIVILRKKKRP